MQKFEKQKLEDAYLNWLDPVLKKSDYIFATVKFKKEVFCKKYPLQFNKMIGSKTVQHFRNKLKRLAYGNSAKKGRRNSQELTFIPVMEGEIGYNTTHFHYHILIEVPSTCTALEWCTQCEEIWKKMDWADKTSKFLIGTSGCLSYVFKIRTKPDYAEALDITNLEINNSQVAEVNLHISYV